MKTVHDLDEKRLSARTTTDQRQNNYSTPKIGPSTRAEIIGKSFKNARIRAGYSRSALSRRVCELGGHLKDFQIKRIEEGKTPSVDLGSIDIAMIAMGAEPIAIFSSALEEYNDTRNIKRSLAHIVKHGDPFLLSEIFIAAFRHTDKTLSDFNYELKISY